MHKVGTAVDPTFIQKKIIFQAKQAELVEIESDRENRLVGILLAMGGANNQTGFWTGGIVRYIGFNDFPNLFLKHVFCGNNARVSEPACFGAFPAPGIFYPEPAPAPAPGKREHDFGMFEN